MIKNIIFDVGNVLVRWTRHDLANMLFPNNEHNAYIAENYILRSEIWPQIDIALEPMDVILNKWKQQLPEEDHHVVDETINNFCKIVGFDLEVNKWGIEMKKKGYKIYILTNYCIYFPDLLQRMPLRDCVDGYICSSFVKMVKPDLRIYKCLFDTYNLNPKECLFIDDLKSNTDAALEAGMGQVVTFTGDINQLKELHL